MRYTAGNHKNAVTEAAFSVIPGNVRLGCLPELPRPLGEMELQTELSRLSALNKTCKPCFLGAGVYDHFIPSAIAALASRSEFLTAYTPYQPEVSQGTLSVIFEFQTMIARLTGMDIANASMYDAASAAAEAVLMAAAVTGRTKVLISRSVHPHIRRTVATYARFAGLLLTEFGFDPETGRSFLPEPDAATAAVLIQNPNFFGIIEDISAFPKKAHAAGALAIAVCDPLALSVLKTPGEADFDIAVGECQPLGMPMSFGGPYAGYMSARKEFSRRMPGRIAGMTEDAGGKRCFVLTLQAREQHIRREKATSNICTNAAHAALCATIYMSLMGDRGMRRAAALCVQNTYFARDTLINTGRFEPVFTAPLFRELPLRAKSGVVPEGVYALEPEYPELSGCFLAAVTEKRSRDEIEAFAEGL